MAANTPSQETDRFWIHALNKHFSKESNPNQAGKWILYFLKEEIDSAWMSVKIATENGTLGDAAKVSTENTTSPNYNTTRSVIYVETYDFSDESDVFRVGAQLSVMFPSMMAREKQILYKTDIQTIEDGQNIPNAGFIYKLEFQQKSFWKQFLGSFSLHFRQNYCCC